MKIKRVAESLVRKYKTRNPFKIAEAMGVIVLRVPMKGLRGFYQHIKRCTIIYIDSALNDWDAEFVCAHELGHAILHPGCNRIFMDTHAYFKVNTYEIDADRFAVDLLYSDEMILLFYDFPVQLLADSIGVSVELAAYRLDVLQNVS